MQADNPCNWEIIICNTHTHTYVYAYVIIIIIFLYCKTILLIYIAFSDLIIALTFLKFHKWRLKVE